MVCSAASAVLYPCVPCYHNNTSECPIVSDVLFFLDSPPRLPLALCLALSLWCVCLCLLCALSPCLCVLWPALCVALCLALTCVPRPYTPLYMGCL